MKRFFPPLHAKEPQRTKLEIDPLRMITWNCNGLTARLRNGHDMDSFSSYLRRTNPDAILLQEVKIAAAGPPGAKRNDGQSRNRQNMKRDDAQSIEDHRLVKRWLKSDPIDKYDAYFSLADWKYAGTCLLLKKEYPSNVRYSLQEGDACETDGRVILAEFPSFWLLNTYVPNNGWTEETFLRRRKWDGAMSNFLQTLKKPLVWMGDLNVAQEEADVSHPDLFRSVVSDKDVPPPQEEDRGQPGYTLAERSRFDALKRCGDLVDCYRALHPAPTPEGFTWRGSPPSYARSYGKGMRIDYALVSSCLFPRVASTDIVGYGAERNDFFGSDHCPVLLVLRPRHEDAASDGSKQKKRVVLQILPDGGSPLETSKRPRGNDGIEDDRILTKEQEGRKHT